MAWQGVVADSRKRAGWCRFHTVRGNSFLSGPRFCEVQASMAGRASVSSLFPGLCSRSIVRLLRRGGSYRRRTLWVGYRKRLWACLGQSFLRPGCMDYWSGKPGQEPYFGSCPGRFLGGVAGEVQVRVGPAGCGGEVLLDEAAADPSLERKTGSGFVVGPGCAASTEGDLAH